MVVGGGEGEGGEVRCVVGGGVWRDGGGWGGGWVVCSVVGVEWWGGWEGVVWGVRRWWGW